MADFFFNAKSGGAGFQLAPDVGGLVNAPNGLHSVVVDASTGLTTALSLTGKYAISSIFLSSLVSGQYRIKLTIDDVVIYDDTSSSGDYFAILGMYRHGASSILEYGSTYLPVICESSMLLEVDSSATSDTTVYVNYCARPIL